MAGADMPGGPVSEQAARAMTAASRFLLDRQSADGAWRDFSTEPGVADAWTTAYVGLSLLTLRDAAQPPAWQESLTRAASWLSGRMDRSAGWGYNADCPPDADSSAHAVLFLRHCGFDVPIEAYRKLLGYQRPDGAFATYAVPGNQDSWGVSHPCVTPVVVHALLTCLPPDDPHLAPALDYIASGQTAAGVWRSFWWGSDLYSTAVNLEAAVELELTFDRAALEGHLRARRADTAFELALTSRCWTLLGRLDEAERVLVSLLPLQQPDGAWPSSPMLRVTRRSCLTPWDDPNPGALHADQERLFTTATALRGLAEWARRRAMLSLAGR